MFEQPTYTGSEGGPPVMICAQITALMGTLDCDLVVTFSAIPDAKTGMTNLLIEKFLLVHNCYEYCVSNIQPGCLYIVDAPLAFLQWNQVIFIICTYCTYNANVVEQYLMYPDHILKGPLMT